VAEKIGLQAVLEDAQFQQGIKRYVHGLDEMQRRTTDTAQTSGGAMSGLGVALMTGLGAAIGVVTAQLIPKLVSGLQQIGSTIVDIGGRAIMTAARVEEMGVVVKYLGEQAGYSEKQLDAFVAQIKEAGIRTDVAQGTVAQFAQYQLDLAKATDLVAVAQGVAIKANEDSSESMQVLIDAVVTQNTMMLRRRGIIVNMGKAMEDHAKLLGKEADELDDAERAHAALNATLAAGQPLIGLYGAAMETAGKQIRSIPRYVAELLLEIGIPFQTTFSDAVFLLVDFTAALTIAAQEGGWLNTILKELGATVNTLAAPFISFGRTAIGVMQDLYLVMGTFRGPDVDLMRSSIADLERQITGLKPPDLSKGWQDEASEIVKINRDLGAAIGRIWEDVNRSISQSMDDWNRRRGQDLGNWLRDQARDLEDFHRSIAEVFADVDERISEMMADREKDRARESEAWNQQVQRAQQRHEDDMANLRRDANMAETKEEYDLIQSIIAEKEAQFKDEQTLEAKNRREALAAEEREFQAELAKEKRRAQERAAVMEVEFNRRRAREEEDRQIRLRQDEEEFNLRMARQREEAGRRETDLKAASSERLAALNEEIAQIQKRQEEGYIQQRAALSLQLAKERMELVSSLAQMPALHAKYLVESAAAYDRLSEVFAQKLGIQFPLIKAAWDAEDWSSLGDMALLAIWRVDWDTRAKVQGVIAGFVVDWMTSYIKGILSYDAVAALAMGSIMVKGLQKMREKIGDFWTLGYNVMLAFGKGMLYLQDWIADVVRDLMGRAVRAALDKLGIGSPSRVFLEIGQNLDLALAEGIRSLGHLPALEMGRVAGATMHSVSNVTTNNYYQNLTVHSASPVEPIIQDFHMMSSMS